MSASQIHGTPRERILKGKEHWWFVGPGGIARLRQNHLGHGRELAPEAERQLREQGLYAQRPYGAYSLTVLTSTDCNLGCAYCFQNTGQDPSGGSRPPRIAHSRLKPEVITDVLEFARRQMAAAGLEKLHILLFGGEPLLNRRGCAELLARAADYGLVSAAMFTNATLLTPSAATELYNLRLRTVQVTFDGDRDDHDRIRVRRSRGGTFDAIVRNIARASAAAPLRWSLRVNVSHHNVGGIDTLVERLAAALDPSRCMIYFARVGDVGIGYENGLLHTGDLVQRFVRWQRRALELGFSIDRPRAHTPCQTCSYTGGRFGAVVNADGVLASCWETAGKPGWDVGSAREGYLPGEQTRSRWISCEDTYRYDDDASALALFRDDVDAAMLDFLYETGRL